MQISGRYSLHARRAMTQARLFAQDQAHGTLDTSHLLVGTLRTPGSIGHRVLTDLNMTLTEAETLAVALYAPQDTPHAPDPIPASAALRSTLTYAVEESTLLGHHYVGTEHLLLGLARGGGGAAQPLLREFAISLDQLRRQVRRMLQAGETEIGIEQALRLARLSELSRRVISAASLNAQALGHPQPGLMHLILALVQEHRSPSGRVLRRCGLDERKLEAALARRPTTRGIPEAAGALEEVLDDAVRYAEHQGDHYTGTDHIVATLAHDRRGARLLATYGVDVERLLALLRRTEL
ncbi:MAG: hypothetical protein JW910_14095 [Anaerolineae bacterium]|nr:hypothetical protein [Anaerolineae bacterium]